MIRTILSDWKHLVMLFVTGVTSPLWLTRLQSPEKEIAVNLVSQPAFQLPANNAASGLKLVLDGQALINPYLSVFL